MNGNRHFVLLVGIIGVLGALAIVAVVLLLLRGIAVPDLFVALPGMAMTGLAGALTQPRSSQRSTDEKRQA